MQIAFIAPFGVQLKGTVSFRMLPLAKALAGRGHNVRVVIPPWDDPQAVAGTRIEAVGSGQLAIETIRLPHYAPASLGITSRLLRSALHSSGGRGGKPDVAHVFKPIGYSGLAGLALSALRVPWVLDTDDWEGPGGWADTNPYSASQRLSLTVMEALLPRMARVTTAASRTLEARAWDFGLPRRRVLYLPNGIPHDKYAPWTPAPNPVRNAVPTLLLYTRFAEFPWPWALEVLAQVKVRHPAVRLLVVGSGFFGEEQLLEAEAKERGLADSVSITGRVPESDLPAYLAQADVALYPMQDTLLNRAKSSAKLLEQMVMGLPIVAHRVGQVPEFLGDGGVMLPPGDILGMANAASALLSNVERRYRLGTLARERVWSEFNWERLSAVAEQAYTVAAKVRQ